MTGLILEGIVGSGKTSVIHYLKKYFFKKDCSLLLLTEHDTERPMEPLRSANPVQSVAHLDQLVSIVKSLHDIHEHSPMDPRHDTHFIFERFHLSHCLDIAGIENFAGYGDTDRQLKFFGCKLVVLTIEENSILERSVISTKKWRDDQWGKYLSQIAATDDEVADHYKNQQKSFLKLCQQSLIPSMVVDASNRDWEEISFQIIEFLNRP